MAVVQLVYRGKMERNGVKEKLSSQSYDGKCKKAKKKDWP